MSQFLGMDVQEVHNLANQLNNSASEIQSIINTITGQLNGVQWTGTDATRFRGDWTGTHVAQLTTVKNALEDASRLATQNAQQQEQASS
jgi:uncharacterized protein YukE